MRGESVQMSAAAIYSIDCPLSAFSLSASFGRIFVFDPAVFVLATSGKRQKEGDVSLSLSLSVSPSGRTEYQSAMGAKSIPLKPRRANEGRGRTARTEE